MDGRGCIVLGVSQHIYVRKIKVLYNELLHRLVTLSGSLRTRFWKDTCKFTLSKTFIYLFSRIVLPFNIVSSSSTHKH
jgi:hypothetical protein